MVFLNAALKKTSLPSLLKLLRPMNCIALLPSHLRNASANANKIGTSVNTANPIKFGAMNEYETKSLLKSRLSLLPDLFFERVLLNFSIRDKHFFFSLLSSIPLHTLAISSSSSACKVLISAIFFSPI